MEKPNINAGKFDSLLEYIVELGAPGCSLMIYKDHKELYRGKAGYNDTETEKAVEYSDIVNLYSSSKVMTCTAMLKLIGSGKVLFTDPLYDFIPEFKDIKVCDTAGNGTRFLREAKRPITILDLFTMSAGLDYDLASQPILKVREKTDGRCPTVETITALAQKPLLFDPGEHYNYSLCHDVLGAVIEIVSGMSFGEYMRANIFEPLEMSDTCFKLNDEQKTRLMCQYCYNSEKKKVEKISTACAHKLGDDYESGGAGIFSTLEDSAVFADALACGGVGRNGKRIIGEDMLSLMRENQFEPKRYAEFAHAGYGYGLGVKTHMDRAKSLHPSPLGEFGWGGAAGTMMLIDPVNRISMFYVQHMLNTPYNFVDRLYAALYS